MKLSSNPLICALDTTDIDQAQKLAAALQPHVGAIKLGLEFFTANGAAGVHALANRNLPVFLDLKFHDIPNTVARAIAATAGVNTFMMTVHTAGGRGMLRAAIDASDEVASLTGQERPLIVGVTVLTSLDQDDLSMVGVRDNVRDQVLRLADLAQDSGLDGVVCSPYEISALRRHCGNDFVLVVPGIRPEGSGNDDQKRVMTPREAVDKGADFLVIGRPITQSSDPARTAREILESVG